MKKQRIKMWKHQNYAIIRLRKSLKVEGRTRTLTEAFKYRENRYKQGYRGKLIVIGFKGAIGSNRKVLR